MGHRSPWGLHLVIAEWWGACLCTHEATVESSHPGSAVQGSAATTRRAAALAGGEEALSRETGKTAYLLISHLAQLEPGCPAEARRNALCVSSALHLWERHFRPSKGELFSGCITKETATTAASCRIRFSKIHEHDFLARTLVYCGRGVSLIVSESTCERQKKSKYFLKCGSQ